jgi:hypothetical protein
VSSAIGVVVGVALTAGVGLSAIVGANVTVDVGGPFGVTVGLGARMGVADGADAGVGVAVARSARVELLPPPHPASTAQVSAEAAIMAANLECDLAPGNAIIQCRRRARR